MPPQRRLHLVEVTWTDSFTHDSGWDTVGDYVHHINSTSYIIKTVGFLLHTDRQKIILSPSLDPFNKCSGAWIIPRGVIKKIRRLK